MDYHHSSDDQLLDLFDKAISGIASSEELRAVNECLRGSQEHREKYRGLAALHADLAGVVRLSRARQLVYEEIRARAALRRPDQGAFHSAGETDIASRVLADEASSSRKTQDPKAGDRRLLSSFRVIRPVWLVAAVSLLLACVLFFSVQEHAPVDVERLGSEAETVEPADALAEKNIVGYLTLVKDATWREGAVHYAKHDALQRDAAIAIDVGQVGVEFVDGARVVVAGPAELIVRSEWCADLRSGRLSVEVPAWATGFTVNAPHFRAVDRGTSFALVVEEGDASGAVVLEGVVDIDRRHLGGTAEENSFMRLRKGNGVWTDGNVTTIDSTGPQLREIAKRAPAVPQLHGDRVANYRHDFLVGSKDAPTNAPGWSYLYNFASQFGDPAGYRDLRWDGIARYDCNGAEPHPGPFPFRYLSLRPDGGHPGCGVNQQGSDDKDLFTIAAYTVPRDGNYRLDSAWVLANNWERWKQPVTQDAEVAVHLNDREPIIRKRLGPTGFVNFNCQLGLLKRGDSIYVGVGPCGDDSMDGFDWNFTVMVD